MRIGRYPQCVLDRLLLREVREMINSSGKEHLLQCEPQGVKGARGAKVVREVLRTS